MEGMVPEGMSLTILRLPNMEVVLTQPTSDQELQEDSHRELREHRRRMNSTGMDSEEEPEADMKKKEPAHRRKNRRRAKKQQRHNQKSDSGSIAEKEMAEMQRESGMEKTMVEELLRKYGFGHWTQPEEETSDNSSATEIPEN